MLTLNYIPEIFFWFIIFAFHYNRNQGAKFFQKFKRERLTEAIWENKL